MWQTSCQSSPSVDFGPEVGPWRSRNALAWAVRVLIPAALLLTALPTFEVDALATPNPQKASVKKRIPEKAPESPSRTSNSGTPGTPASALGSTSEAEAQYLWTEGREQFEAGEFEEAARVLKRLVDRYPGHSAGIQADFLLGQSNLALGRAALAIKSLRNVVHASPPKTEAAFSARVALAQAYFENDQPEHSVLTLRELIELTRDLPVTHPVVLRTALVKARAELAMGKSEQARATLESVLKVLPELDSSAPSTPLIKTEAAQAELDWRLKECMSLPGAGKKTESQLIHSLERRGLCLQEALSVWNQVQASARKAEIEQITNRIAKSYKAYFEACTKIPDPPQELTPVQLRKYKGELRTRLREICRDSYYASFELASKFIANEPPGSANAPVVAPKPEKSGSPTGVLPPKEDSRLAGLKKALQAEFKKFLESKS